MDNTMETKNTLQAHRSLQSFTRFFYLTVKVYRTLDCIHNLKSGPNFREEDSDVLFLLIICLIGIN